jgi:VanZ family protein
MFMRAVYWGVKRRLLHLLVLFAVAGALLFLPLPIPPTFAGRTIENAGHVPLFFLVTLGAIYVLRADPRFTGWKLYLVAGLAGVTLGFLSEVIQRPLKRDASWEDVAADAIGTLCALAVYALFERHSPLRRWHRLVALLVATACLVFYVTPIVNMTRAYFYRNGQFPVLASFKQDIEKLWTRSIGATRDVVDGRLDVEFLEGRTSGVEFYEPVADWRRFKTLVIDVENPAPEPLALGVYVFDERHKRQFEFTDRFNRSFQLAPRERRTLRISVDDIRRGPRNRPMDISRISNISLYRDANTGSRRLRIHILRLE